MALRVPKLTYPHGGKPRTAIVFINPFPAPRIWTDPSDRVSGCSAPQSSRKKKPTRWGGPGGRWDHGNIEKINNIYKSAAAGWDSSCNAGCSHVRVIRDGNGLCS